MTVQLANYCQSYTTALQITQLETESLLGPAESSTEPLWPPTLHSYRGQLMLLNINNSKVHNRQTMKKLIRDQRLQ